MTEKLPKIARYEVLTTEDGSPTLRETTLGTTFHSIRGAWTETDWVYGREGLDHSWKMFNNPARLSLIELGYGSGLAALWAANWADSKKVALRYVSIEASPLDPATRHSFGKALRLWRADLFDLWQMIDEVAWGKLVAVTSHFSILKIPSNWSDLINEDLSFGHEKDFNLCFYDPFSPADQPEMWTLENFKLVADLLCRGGHLVTYSVQGAFRRSLQACGFAVEKIPGPPGKREMARAVKSVPE